MLHEASLLDIILFYFNSIINFMIVIVVLKGTKHSRDRRDPFSFDENSYGIPLN